MHTHCINRPPFANMASNANGPPLSSERRGSAVYQPMVRLLKGYSPSDISPLEEPLKESATHECTHPRAARHSYHAYLPRLKYNLPPLTSSTIYRPLLEEQSPPEGLGGFLAVLKAAGGLDQLAKHT